MGKPAVRNPAREKPAVRNPEKENPAENPEKENPEKEFIAIGNLECADMKKITLEKLRDSLLNMRSEVTVPEEIANRARKAIQRMLEVV